ncbi:MAG: nucleotide exchange factor GrpE [Gammaproteobacteria bacterium]|nr:nucleotide exchange factor GrpE [Gammaproteobacteria bacterium]
MPNSEEEKNASSAIEDNAAGAEKPADAQAAETGAAPQAEAELAASETEVGAAADEEETEADPLDDLNAKLEEAMAQLEDYRDQALRAEAEMQNVRRRAERDVANAHKFGLEKFLGNLVPVVDSLEKAIEAAEQAGKADDPIVEGVQLCLKLLLDLLEKENVKVLDPVGEPFDPQFHEAMSMIENPDVEPNSVVLVVQKGYVLNERLVRPAMVMVAKGESPSIDEKA